MLRLFCFFVSSLCGAVLSATGAMSSGQTKMYGVNIVPSSKTVVLDYLYYGFPNYVFPLNDPASSNRRDVWRAEKKIVTKQFSDFCALQACEVKEIYGTLGNDSASYEPTGEDCHQVIVMFGATSADIRMQSLLANHIVEDPQKSFPDRTDGKSKFVFCSDVGVLVVGYGEANYLQIYLEYKSQK